MRSQAFFSSLSVSVWILLFTVGDLAQALHRPRGSYPPYLGARHRSLLIARVEAPPACATKLSANTTGVSNPMITGDTSIPSANGTFPTNTTLPTDITDNSASGFNSTAVNSTVPASTVTAATTPDPTNTTLSGDNSTVTDSSDPSVLLTKRIAQVDLPDVASAWQALCLISGGDVFTETGVDSPCVTLAGLDGINALQADADPCAQQDIADAMMDFAKIPGVINSDVLTAFAVAYRKHPRNAVDMLGIIPSTLYCQRPPKNPELDGVVNGQLDGVDPGVFGGPNTDMVPFGAPGTCPLGQTPDVSTCSCIPSGSDDGSAFNSTNPTTLNTDTTFNSTDSTTSNSTDSTANSTSVASTDTAFLTDSTASPTADSATLADVTDATVSATSATSDDTALETASATDVGAPATATATDVTDSATAGAATTGAAAATSISMPPFLFNATLPESASAAVGA